jgi:hypothetical protein
MMQPLRAANKPLVRCNMEELAARQAVITPKGGILFARNVDGDEKRAARQLVVDLFTIEKWNRPLNMVVMPGVHWRFERLMLGVRQKGWMHHRSPHGTHFTAVENDRSIYHAALTQMPGVETPDRLIKPVRRERFPFAEMAFKTRFVSFFFANVDEFMTHEWKQASYREAHMLGWDAAWLDYTGPLSVERLAIIVKFYERFVRSTLIVTALKARWNRETSGAIARAGGHASWLRRHLDGEVLHELEYQDTSPMAQFAVRKI